MTNDIVRQYGIAFKNRVLDFGASGKKVFKVADTANDTLSEFLTDWDRAQDVTDLLISDINDVLANVADLRENGSETISIDIEHDVVTFYIKNVGTNYPTIPTSDFLQIVTMWRDFLLQPPLSGSIV